MKKTLILLVIIIIGVGIYYYNKDGSGDSMMNGEDNMVATSTDEGTMSNATSTDDSNKPVQLIGKSVEGRDINAYHYGAGSNEIIFVGGIHGGYEWNTALVAYQTMDYLEANPSVVPENLKITVIPVVNPDGLNKVVGTTSKFSASSVSSSQEVVVSGRFNANNVDLNRNFDCDWQADGKWQDKTVSGGANAFSEPESQAVRDYIEAHNPSAVIVWYSAAGGVYASNCHGEVLAETKTLTNTFAKASGYPAHESFNFYEITGDMVNWLAKKGVPAISVLLTNHTDTEWTKNKAGIDAVLKYYSNN